MKKSANDESVGPWAKEKLDALAQYLNYYTTVLKNQGRWLRGTIYVDAFAGPGRSRVRTKLRPTETASLFASEGDPDPAQVEFLKGSPRIALDITNPFTSYIFIERDAKRIAELTAISTEYRPRRAIRVEQADANDALLAWLRSAIDWRHHRAVVFLDPFGMQVPWSTIEALAQTRAIEVIINFPLGMAIQRLLTKSGQIPDEWKEALERSFGSPDWYTMTYGEAEGLFGRHTSKLPDAGPRLLEWYRQRLKTAFGHVSTARLIKNTRGNPLYYLIWAGANEKGLKGANYILSKGERVASAKSQK